LGPEEKEKAGLPKQFNYRLYEEIAKFLNDRPIHNPVYMRDSLNPRDKETMVKTLEEVLQTPQTEDSEPELDPITQHGPQSLGNPGSSQATAGHAAASPLTFKASARNGSDDRACASNILQPEAQRANAIPRDFTPSSSAFNKTEIDVATALQEKMNSRNIGKPRRIQPIEIATQMAESNHKEVV
jgi:hypothetical protein